MKWEKITVIVILVAVLPSFVVSKTFGQTSSSINASIKISVCGNGIIENGEDCEGTDLNNKTCQSLGYSGGTLSCDISCSFNTTQCIAPTPTPTPTPTPIPTVTPTFVPTPTSTQDTTQSQTQTSAIADNKPTPTPTILQTPASEQTVIFTPPNPPKNTSTLPIALKIFDFNGDGKIDSDLHGVVSLWINSWKQFLTRNIQNNKTQPQITDCDLNHNGSCNLDDFSILMYYIGR